MAKVYKISAYIVDYNDMFKNTKALKDHLYWRLADNILLEHLKINNADIGEWSDNHPLNYIDCSIDVVESFFKNKKRE